MKQTLIVTATLIAALAGSALPSYSQDVTAGEKVFKKCKACHKIGDGSKNGVGPHLTGVVGRPAGSVEGYKYGTGMKQAGAAGLVWTEELILEYITDPSSRHDGLLHRASHRTGHADHASGSLDWSIKMPAQAGQIPAGC